MMELYGLDPLEDISRKERDESQNLISRWEILINAAVLSLMDRETSTLSWRKAGEANPG